MKTLLMICLLIPTLLCGQITYNWNNKRGGSWAESTNWNPVRNNPAINDILIIEQKEGNALTIDHVPTQTVGKLVIKAHSNGSGKIVYLLPENSVDTLIIQGVAGDIDYDFWIESSNLQVVAPNIDVLLRNNTISLNKGILSIHSLLLQ